MPLHLYEHFEWQALRSPSAVALRAGGRAVSYDELRRHARRIAGGLRVRGVGGGSLVGVHLDRSADWVAAVLGVLGCGAAVVPLPPSDPPGRRRRIFDHVGMDAVVDGGRGSSDLPPGTRVLQLGALLLQREEDDPGVPDGSPESPAFVLSSSGSTGHPKMIVRSHRSFFHRLEWTWSGHPFGPDEIGCQKAHMTTTHAVYELFEPLLRGAPTVVVPDREVRDLERFWSVVRRQGVSRLLIVPSALRASLDMPGFEAPPLRMLVLMGEYLHADLAERAVEAFPEETRLFSIYGSTEASSTLAVDLRAELRPGAELPLGAAIHPDVRIRVLDPRLERVGPGEEGRLYVGGTPLFSGYLNDPELTDSVLVEIPGEDEVFYDTRDQVRAMPDGSLRFVGRVDHTVKIRGYRVELTEVENAVRQHPGVRQATVVVSSGDDQGDRLAAFYVPGRIGRSEVYETLRELLPPYMVPSTLVGLDGFPLTDSGKVDRVRLAEEYASPPSEEAEEERDISGVERRVADAWTAVLGHGRFGPGSSFFEVGGTSLTVFRLVHRLREDFELEPDRLSANVVYRRETLEALADYIDRLREGRPPRLEGSASLLVSLRKATDPEVPPLFVVASAGGTLGAYERLAGALETDRDVLGVRDPYILGDREGTEGFQAWVDRYLDAVRERQPRGPYHLCAYSSAGAFGFELARRLRAAGEEVGLLTLVDPHLDRGSRARFGYWTMGAIWMRPPLRWLVRAAASLRAPALRIWMRLRRPRPSNDHGLSEEEHRSLAVGAVRDRAHVANLAALLELNTGLPFALSDDELEAETEERYLDLLLSRARSLMPSVDPTMIERIAEQYPMQVRAQHQYRLQPYDGRVLMVEPQTAHAGLGAELLRPYVRELERRIFPVGAPSDREREVSRRFGNLATHYRCMRDDRFVRALAAELDSRNR